MKRTAFYVSDGTGITAETLGHSMLSQFGGIKFDQVTLPYVISNETTHDVVQKINRAAELDGATPIVFSTLVNDEHREILARCNGLVLDMFAAFLGPLEQELGVRSSHTIGQSHSIRDHEAYRIRIDAVHFALDNDDGARTRHYDQADVILIGVSRSGKTPTSLYLALQFGLYTANYPLTEDDFDDLRLPDCLVPHKGQAVWPDHQPGPVDGHPQRAQGWQPLCLTAAVRDGSAGAGSDLQQAQHSVYGCHGHVDRGNLHPHSGGEGAEASSAVTLQA